MEDEVKRYNHYLAIIFNGKLDAVTGGYTTRDRIKLEQRCARLKADNYMNTAYVVEIKELLPQGRNENHQYISGLGWAPCPWEDGASCHEARLRETYGKNIAAPTCKLHTI